MKTSREYLTILFDRVQKSMEGFSKKREREGVRGRHV